MKAEAYFEVGLVEVDSLPAQWSIPENPFRPLRRLGPQLYVAM